MTIESISKMLVRLLGAGMVAASAWLVFVLLKSHDPIYIVFPFVFLLGGTGLCLLISGKLDGV